MAFFHGVRTEQADTVLATPVVTQSGITFAVGAAPVHTVDDGKINEPVMCLNWGEAVTNFGYNDDWGKYEISEVMFSQFKLYGVSPTVFVNVLDPATHKKSKPAADFQVADGRVILPFEAIKKSVAVKSSGTGGTAYKVGEDFELFYDDKNLVLEIIDGGAIPNTTATLSIAFDAVDPSMITENDIIGGFDVTTKKYSGLELIDKVFPKYGIVTDLIIAPGWSHKPTVAAVMTAKAQNINGVFEGKAVIDVDTEAVKHYSDAPQWKKDNNIFSKFQILCFPMLRLGDRIFHFSTHAVGRMALTDNDNAGSPAESPSNKSLQIDSACLADGTEVLLDFQQANYLNANGIVTALNFIGGYVLWGNWTACFPADTDVKNYFISVSRMFGWVANSLILTYWSRVDRKMTRRFADSIIDSINIWMNGLTSQGLILGGRVEMLADENSLVDLMSGKITLHIFMTPPSPAKEILFILQYDISYVQAALAA